MPSRIRRFLRLDLDDPLPHEWVDLVSSRLAAWAFLTDDQRVRLLGLTGELVRGKHWEAANGFALTDEIRLTIAAHAALLVLELGIECYDSVETIIVHPSTIVRRGERAGPAPGLVSSGPLALLGETYDRGPLLVAWDAARQQARHPERGHNVVFHEFAHRLDMLDGVVDGTPPLEGAALDRWVEVCTAEFLSLRAGTAGPLLDDYGAESPGEFFAVATEVFFSRPVDLREAKPDLYGVLRDFYRQDPAAAR